MANTLDLLQFRQNFYSHNGEDGVLAHLLGKLPSANKWAVEFGAWDGKWASNTCHLLETQGWNVVFIECDAAKFEVLKGNHGSNPKAHLVQRFISFEGADSLDGIFSSVPGFPEEPDLVSMDIDGCEYHLWESLEGHRPKIVLCEFNPSFPIDHSYIQPKDFSVNHSSSLRAFVELGERKGYTLISVLDYNGIFLRNDLVEPMGLVPASVEELNKPFRDKYQTRLWQSMDGRIHLLGCNRLIWHNVTINPEKIQVLPKFLRINPAGSGWLRDTLRFFYYKVPFVPQLFNFVVSGRFTVPKADDSR